PGAPFGPAGPGTYPRRVTELRWLGALLIGAVAPAWLVFSARDMCSASDLCLVGALGLVLGVPIGAVAGVLAAIVTPREEAWSGFGFAAFGIPIGTWAALVSIGSPGGLGEAVMLFGPPVFVGLALGFAVTRFLRRRRGEPAVPPEADEPA